MTISVIIPTRNRQSYVNNLINDLKRQIAKPNEILIIDQSANPLDIVETEGIVHIIDNGEGPCRARNLGASHSNGEILVFLDDDIRITPDFLENLCDPIIRLGYSASTGAILNVDGNYKKTKANYWRNDSFRWITALTADPGHSGLGISLSFAAGCSAIKREIFSQLGGFDLFFDPNGAGEDREFALRLFHAGYPIFYNGQAKVIHLGAKSGGRNSTSKYYYELSPLEANLIYIVAKYFGWNVFDNYCKEIRRSILNSSITPNPSSWFHTLKKITKIKQWMRMIKRIKVEKGWK